MLESFFCIVKATNVSIFHWCLQSELQNLEGILVLMLRKILIHLQLAFARIALLLGDL